MTNVTESAGPPRGPLPRKGDWQTRIRNMRTMRLRRALIRTAAPREIFQRKRSRYSGLPAPHGQL